MRKSIFFALFFCQQVAFATMFTKLSFQKQLEESSGAFEGKVISKKSYKNRNGMIVTDYTFEVTENFNLSNDEIKNNQVIVTIPGGTVDGTTSFIDSAPDFKIGERHLLLIKNVQSKIYLSNFTLGKYNIEKNEKGEEVYTSEVFPTDPELSKISKNVLLKKLKNKRTEQERKEVFDNEKNKEQSSEVEESEKSIPQKIKAVKKTNNLILAILVLVIFSVIGFVLRKKRNDK